jgi:drug/metabolite transporter (DMT)-like permease
MLLAFLSNIAFASASILFTQFSKRTSSAWMNFYKAFISSLCFAAVCLIFNLWTPLSHTALVYLLLSGSLGLMIGDIFLLQSFTLLGSGRVLMIFGFQPLFLGFFSHLFFGQSFSPYRMLAVFLLIACLFSFSLETYRSKGHWDQKGLIYAFIGVFLDAIGVLLTRGAFELHPDLSPFEANLARAVVTAVGFFIASLIPFFKFSVIRPWQSLEKKEKAWVTGASFVGTFLSLSFYLMAIQKGHLATISAIAGTSPLFATLFEVLLGKKKVTKYLVWGVLFFVSGMAILFFETT